MHSRSGNVRRYRACNSQCHILGHSCKSNNSNPSICSLRRCFAILSRCLQQILFPMQGSISLQIAIATSGLLRAPVPLPVSSPEEFFAEERALQHTLYLSETIGNRIVSHPGTCHPLSPAVLSLRDPFSQGTDRKVKPCTLVECVERTSEPCQ